MQERTGTWRISTAPRFRVRDLMSPLGESIKLSDTIELATIDADWGHLRYLPVLDSLDRFVGLITRFDLLLAAEHCGGMGRVPTALVMQSRVATITPDHDITAAMELLLDNRLAVLPVIDPSRRLLGLLSESDFVRHLYNQHTGREYLEAI